MICCGTGIIARHPRCYGREETIYDPLHYLALLEHKTNALEQAAPLQQWQLPAEFAQLRHLLEVRPSQRGKHNGKRSGQREYIQVLRLLECFPFETVAWAICEALRLQAISLDAVKHLVLCRIEQRPAHLDLTLYPHLPVAQVSITAVSEYLGLLSYPAKYAASAYAVEGVNHGSDHVDKCR